MAKTSCFFRPVKSLHIIQIYILLYQFNRNSHSKTSKILTWDLNRRIFVSPGKQCRYRDKQNNIARKHQSFFFISKDLRVLIRYSKNKFQINLKKKYFFAKILLIRTTTTANIPNPPKIKPLQKVASFFVHAYMSIVSGELRL